MLFSSLKKNPIGILFPRVKQDIDIRDIYISFYFFNRRV